MLFEFYRLRFNFRAIRPIYFPGYHAGNIFRGAFGSLFKSVACDASCNNAKSCDRTSDCPYALAFEPRTVRHHGPSGLLDPPRPFVFRAAHLNGCRVGSGGQFHLDVHVFDVRNPRIEFFTAAFRRLASEGLGPQRASAELVYVDQLDGNGSRTNRLCDFYSPRSAVLGPPLIHDLTVHAGRMHRLTVRFVTPTELKNQKWNGGEFAFSSLFARLRDRISTLRMLYGAGPLNMDFQAAGRRAEAIELVRSDFRRASVQRRSSRSGQRHPIGGFIGEAEYQGELGEFMPYLQLGKWVGVGRHTVWGNGQIEVLERGN